MVRLADYQRRWGYDWELYAPILRFARAERIPVLALNTPSEVTRKVARTGLNQLSFAERQWIPPISTRLAELVFSQPSGAIEMSGCKRQVDEDQRNLMRLGKSGNVR